MGGSLLTHFFNIRAPTTHSSCSALKWITFTSSLRQSIWKINTAGYSNLITVSHIVSCTWYAWKLIVHVDEFLNKPVVKSATRQTSKRNVRKPNKKFNESPNKITGDINWWFALKPAKTNWRWGELSCKIIIVGCLRPENHLNRFSRSAVGENKPTDRRICGRRTIPTYNVFSSTNI